MDNNNNPPARLARVQVTMSPEAREKLRRIKHSMGDGGRKFMTWDKMVDELEAMYRRQGATRKGGDGDDS